MPVTTPTDLMGMSISTSPYQWTSHPILVWVCVGSDCGCFGSGWVRVGFALGLLWVWLGLLRFCSGLLWVCLGSVRVCFGIALGLVEDGHFLVRDGLVTTTLEEMRAAIPIFSQVLFTGGGGVCHRPHRL